MEHRCLSPWKGAVVGGLIAYAWTALSWTILPFQARMLAPFGEPLPVPAAIAAGLLLRMTGAFFWTWILGKIPGLTLKDSALYGLFFGIGAGALGDLPYWVCWRLPLPLVLMNAVDSAVAWTLASLALSRCYASACALPAKR